jgi:TctA family transporter
VIADAPIAVAEAAPGGVLTKTDAFISAARSLAADGLTLAEFGELLVALLHLAVAALDAVASMTGEEKKAATLDGVAALFDAVADRCVPLVLWPIWGLARGPVRLLVLALATAVGLVPPLANVRRVHAMGAIMLPVMAWSFGFAGF